MAYRANPFLERMSERTTSDQEFVQLFAPKILEKLDEDCFHGGVHVFRSPPGGGKTTILRAFTPNALRAFWHARHIQAETYTYLVDRGVLDDSQGPQLLGVMLSCAAGYADLPPGASAISEGLFRALLDCRVVLRTIRSLIDLLGSSPESVLDALQLEYTVTDNLRSIPLRQSASEVLHWAENREREIYSQLDSISPSQDATIPVDVRFESLLWLQAVKFKYSGREVAPRRLLMIDDVHKLRKAQRALLIDEMVVLRPSVPVWIAGRSIAFTGDFLSQGARDGRDLKDYSLEELWGDGRNTQFFAFAQNILDRRFRLQTTVPGTSFNQYLAENLNGQELADTYRDARRKFERDAERIRESIRYVDWIAHATTNPTLVNMDALVDLYSTRILISRDLSNRQLSLELTPLSTDELEERDSSALKGAAEIFLNHELKVLYYFGIDRLTSMSTFNVEELLTLAAALYDGMKAKQVLRRRAEPHLVPREQEKRLREVVSARMDFISRNHTEGTQAKRLLEAIGGFCRERTFLANAPYAPGVTGIRLSETELSKLQKSATAGGKAALLLKVLSECVAENLLVGRPSSASTSREAGTVFYLNRSLCAHFGLPLQFGGWQECTLQTLTEWSELGHQTPRGANLELSL